MKTTNLIIESETVKIPKNDYLIAVFSAFREFLQEEAAGRMFSEYRLKSSIEAAQKLYPLERRKLDTIIKLEDKYKDLFYRMSKKIY